MPSGEELLLLNEIWSSNGQKTKPTDSEIAKGFECGPANPEFFNWLMNRMSNAIQSLGRNGVAPYDTRQRNDYPTGALVVIDDATGGLWQRTDTPGPVLADPDLSNPNVFWEGPFNLSDIAANRDGLSGVEPTAAIKLQIFQTLYPVGEIYGPTARTDSPDVWLGFGTWELHASGRVIVGRNPNDPDFENLNQEGGEKTHQLTIAEMPSHNHPIDYRTDAADDGEPASQPSVGAGNVGSRFDNNQSIRNTGGDQSHNNLQPYIVQNYWLRTS